MRRHLGLLLLPFLLGCLNSHNSPKVVQGVLDLSSWNFRTSGPVDLDGEWEFYWKKFLDPKESDRGDARASFIQVPGKWEKSGYGKEENSGFGYASYRLRILLPSDREPYLCLKFASVSSSFRLYINGKEIVQGGSPGENPEHYKPGYRPGIFSFLSDKPETEILIQVSNFKYSNGSGLWNQIQLGPMEEIQKISQISSVLDSITFGTLFAMAIYHFTFYLMRRRDSSAIFFALLCLCIAFRVTFYGERIFWNLIPFYQNYDFVVRGEILFLFLLLPGTVLYVKSVFRKEFEGDIVFRMIFYLSVPLVIVPAIAPTEFFTRSFFINSLEFLMIGLLVYLFVKLSAMAFRKVDGARICLFSLLVNLSTVTNDVLYLNKIIDSVYLVPYGVLALVLSQCVLLASRFSKGFVMAENLGEELKELNVNLERIVVERTENLNESLKLLRADLSLAKKLQQKTLPKLNLNGKSLSIHPLYLPMSEIGGDYYDIFEVEPGYFRLFLVDATGHGVQAALLTMTIKAEFERLKTIKAEPSRILELLNAECIQKYQSINIIFSAVLADIDLNANMLYYSSAGHPAQIMKRKEDEADYIYSRGPIIGLKKNAVYKNLPIPLESGNRIFFFSDGIFEEFDQERREFGESRVLSLLSREVELREVAEGLISELKIFVGPKGLQDDVTLLAVEVL